MNMTQSLNLAQAHVFVSLAKTEATLLTHAELIEALDMLPGHTEFDIETQSYTGTGDIRIERFRLMARDIPRPGRRYTCLTTGFEWMDLSAIAKGNDWNAAVIYHPTTGEVVGSCLFD